MNARWRDDERGAAVVWAVALSSLLVLAGFLAAAVAQQALVRQRVATAADVAALAGAQALGDPCDAARRSADLNAMVVISCAVDGADVVVQVSRPAPSLVRRLFALIGGTPHEVVAIARAGPPPEAAAIPP